MAGADLYSAADKKEELVKNYHDVKKLYDDYVAKKFGTPEELGSSAASKEYAEVRLGVLYEKFKEIHEATLSILESIEKESKGIFNDTTFKQFYEEVKKDSSNFTGKQATPEDEPIFKPTDRSGGVNAFR